MSEKEKGTAFLTGRKTILRPARAETDIDNYLRWFNDQEVIQYLSGYLPTTREDEEEWFRNLHKNREKNIVFAIETLEGKHIGNMGIHNINWKDRTATTGAMIGEKEYWGKGYGTDAKMALLNYCFHTLNLRKIASAALATNKRSVHYSLHCGYKIEGTKKKEIFVNGKYQDLVLLAVFRKDFRPIWKKFRKTGSV